MNSFSISDLARYSGVKPHTIRIWEKRYSALTPNRTKGNTRNYDSGQLKRLLNITAMLDSDYKVSELCMMTDEELKSLHGKILNLETAASQEYFVSQLIASALTFDEPQFVQVFSHCLLRFELKKTYLQVLYPALSRIGLMWLNDSLPAANEHFISNLMRQKLFTAVDCLPLPKPDSRTWILFLPENEFHEIGLLLAYYLIRLSGEKVIYLGGNVPELSLKTAIKEVKPDNLLMFLVHEDFQENIIKYLDRLSKDLNVKRIYVAANHKLTTQLKSPKNVFCLKSVEELDEYLG